MCGNTTRNGAINLARQRRNQRRWSSDRKLVLVRVTSRKLLVVRSIGNTRARSRLTIANAVSRADNSYSILYPSRVPMMTSSKLTIPLRIEL